jgi:hypothetical protein
VQRTNARLFMGSRGIASSNNPVKTDSEDNKK